MEPSEIYKRLVALNIVAVFISFRSLPELTFLGNLLFTNKRQMPNDYVQHFSALCLPGMTVSDPVINQMMDVRAQVQDRLNRGVIIEAGKFIFQCSQECLWMFYFQDCGIPNDRHLCTLCKKPIGAERYNVLIKRNPPQIQMSIPEGFRVIDEHIKRYNQTVRSGYHNTGTMDTSHIDDKPDHLNRPVSFRFIHMLTHAVLLLLQEFDYLSSKDLKERFHLPTTTHFRDHFEKDYNLLSQSLIDNQQSYIWIYKLLNHLLNNQFSKPGVLNKNEHVIELEQMIEQKLIFAHIGSVTDEIAEYKKAYAKFIQNDDSEVPLKSFIDESCEDEARYPQLNFFNVTTFYTSNLLDEFIQKMEMLPYSEKTYPLTAFLFKRFDEFVNIRYLYPIVTFANYLIEKFNYRLERMDALQNKIHHYLQLENDQHIMRRLYDDFRDAWYALKLKEVRYGCRSFKFELTVSKEDFAENTSIATLLLNTNRDESGLLLAAIIKTIAELQNEIVSYFNNTIENIGRTEIEQKRIALQSIRPHNLFLLDRIELSQKLLNDSLVLNYQYGKSTDIIYDYEEIEMNFRNMVSSLVFIDTEKLRFFTYQCELYNENTSLINDIRARIKQKQISNDERTKLQRILQRMNKDDILNYLGSLDYVFTYLRNSISEFATESTKIQTFVERHISFHACLNNNVLRREPFSIIQLQNIIDLYELIEENAFDQAIRPYVDKKLIEEAFENDERQRVFTEFSRTTFEKETTGEPLKNIGSWISMLKRLMIRVLNAKVSLDTPLQYYLERTDFWSHPVTDTDLTTFEVKDDILLQHTYVILVALEKKQQMNNKSHQQQTKKQIQTVQEQRQENETFLETTMRSATKPKEVSGTYPKQQKIRI